MVWTCCLTHLQLFRGCSWDPRGCRRDPNLSCRALAEVLTQNPGIKRLVGISSTQYGRCIPQWQVSESLVIISCFPYKLKMFLESHASVRHPVAHSKHTRVCIEFPACLSPVSWVDNPERSYEVDQEKLYFPLFP